MVRRIGGWSLRTPAVQAAIAVARKIWFAGRGETVLLGGHRLQYLPGTRPVRLKYRNDPDLVVRNDVQQLEFFCDNVQGGEFAIDVGASVGQYAVLLGALVGATGRVAAFEPEREARELLQRNVALNGFSSRVTVEPFAVYDSSTEHSFYSRSGDLMCSLERAGFGTNAADPDIVKSTVSTVSLDDYLAANELPAPHWLKIDAEGAEAHILRGAGRALNGPTKIVCELHPYAWSSFGTSFDELLDIVHRAGRSIAYLDGVRDIAAGPDYGAVLIS